MLHLLDTWRSKHRTLRRWNASPHQQSSEWQVTPHYWLIRKRWSEFTFGLLRRDFIVRSKLDQSAEAISAVSQLLRATAGMFLLAFLAVIGLTLVDVLLLRLSPPEPADGIVPGFLVSLWPTLRSLTLESASVLGLLGTFVQVAGVFLGLYFAAVTMVVNAYVSNGSPATVRSRLVDELSRNGYINVIAVFGAIATLLLAGTAIGREPGLVTLACVILLGIVSILGFVVLGLRTFAFLSPVSLTSSLLENLSRWISKATTDGHRWSVPAIQDYNRRQAAQLLKTYRELASFSIGASQVSPEGVARLAIGAVWILRIYSRTKTRIPTSSLWFDRKNVHSSLLTSSYSERSVLQLMGWIGAPKQEPDPLWIERLIGPVVGDALIRLAGSGQVDHAAEVLSTCGDALEAMARSFALDEALALDDLAFSSLAPFVRAARIEMDALKADSPSTRLALGLNELCCLGVIRTILGHTRAVEGVTLEHFQSSINRIVWDRPSTIYNSPRPWLVREQIEVLAKRLEFEVQVEGQLVTPQWYQQQSIARPLVESLQRSVEALLTYLAARFGDATENDIEQRQFVLAAQTVSLGLEACDKMALLLQRSMDLAKNVESLKRLPEEPWPCPDWDNYGNRLKAERRRMVLALGQCATRLATQDPPSTGYPDYFGFSFRVLCNECVAAMNEGDEDLFGNLFPSLFGTALMARDRLVQETDNALEPARTAFVLEPIEDLLLISGLAIIYSELDDKTFWQDAKRSWDIYLDSVQNPSAIIAFLAAATRYREMTLAIPPGAVVRTGWTQQLSRKLRDRGLLSDDLQFFRGRMQVSHPSRVVGAYVGGGWPTYFDPADVFVVLYLIPRDAEGVISLSGPQKSFQHALERGDQDSNDFDFEL